MNKILKFLTEWSITKVLELLIRVLGGTLLVALPILFCKQIAPLLSQTQWLILSASLLALLFLALWKTFQYRYQINSKKRSVKILLKKLEKQYELFQQVKDDQEQLHHWGNATEPLFNYPLLLEFKKDFVSHKSWLLAKGQSDCSYYKQAPQGIIDVMEKAIAALQHEIDLS